MIGNWISWFLNLRNWQAALTALCLLLVLLCSTPYFHYLPELFAGPYWETVMQQANDNGIYQPDGTGLNASTHESKKTFRLTVPMLARVLNLNAWGIYGLQFLLGVVFIFLIVNHVYKRYGDKTLTFWCALAATSVYFGTACFTDVYSYFSGWAFVFLFCAVCFSNPWIVFASSLLAAWTDERGALALIFVALYWQYERLGPTGWWRKATMQAVTVAVAFAAYLTGRFAMQAQGYYTPTVNLFVNLYVNLDLAQFGLWTIFEGLWILVLYKYYVLFTDKRYSFFMVNAAIAGAMLASTLMVWDVTRAGSFMLIEVFLSILIVYRERGMALLNKYVFLSAVVCLLFPPYYVITFSGPIFLQRSALIYALKYVYQHVVL